MRAKTFTVPFSQIVGDDATELEFGPDDHVVIRPLFSLPAFDIREWTERIDEFQLAQEAAPPVDKAKRREHVAKLNRDAGQLILDLMGVCILGWSLVGEDGKPIPQPKTVEALDKLPGALRGSLFGFLTSFRGEEKNPTTSS